MGDWSRARAPGHSTVLGSSRNARIFACRKPYFHTGQADTLGDVLDHYLAFSISPEERDAESDPEIAAIALVPAEKPPIAFLLALDEDYE